MVQTAFIDNAPVTCQAVEAHNVSPVTHIRSNRLYRAEMRLDAAHYNEDTMEAHQRLQASGLQLKMLREVTERIFIPPRFKRVYVDYEHGVPFLQGTHLPHLKPADLKYLSRTAHKGLERWIIEAGWVLVTCSGTIGRVAIALRQWHGWAASQHILRIVPLAGSPCPAGYIYSWLSSPLGQAQFNSVYGAVVDEITASHVENILIPVPETEEQRAIVETINNLALQAVETKEQALEWDTMAVSTVGKLFGEGEPLRLP